GSHFWANVVITSLRNDEGVLVGYAKITRDLTERREAEQHLRATNVELERFAVAVAHDLTEPLHTIVGLADLTARRLDDRLDDESREYLDHIRGGARRLRRLLDALLEYSRTSQREMLSEPVSTGEAVRHVVNGLAARIAEAQATVDFDADALPVVQADPAMLELVLQNLISNALKFRGDEPPRVTITAHQHEDQDDMCCLVVSDNGIGIAPAHRDAIFDLFQRLQPADEYPGTGTGLALVKRIVERHGGEIGVDSKVDEGSRFWFTLPAAGASSAS
ncbi:MAG TPA: ATP-binding protein, partial [Solirubrobacteraceae bacterium]